MWTFAISMILGSLHFVVLMRFGLAAAVFVACAFFIFNRFPITLDASAWYSGCGYAALAIFAIIVLCSFRTSLGGRPIAGAVQ